MPRSGPAVRLAACCALLVPSVAHADPPVGPQPVRLSWVRLPGAESCGAVVDVEAEVARRLRYDPFTRRAERFIEVIASRGEGEWTARITIHEDDGEVGTRDMASAEPECGALVESVALAIALSIDPEAVVRPHPGPDPDPTPARPPERAEPPVVEEMSPAPFIASVSLRGVLGIGTLPLVMGGPALFANVTLVEALRASLGVYFLPEIRDGAFGFGLSAGFAGACYAFIRDPLLDLGLCAELHAGAIRAVVYELVPTTPGDRFWLAGAAAFEAEILLDEWTLALRANAVFPITWYEFHIEREPPTPVFQQSIPGLLVSLGVGRRFR